MEEKNENDKGYGALASTGIILGIVIVVVLALWLLKALLL